MNRRIDKMWVPTGGVLALILCAAWGCQPARAEVGETLILGAYSAPREAFEQALIPAFREAWRRQTGRDVVVRASYLGSGAQTRAIAQGFEADVAVLALETDVDKLAKAGLVARDWRGRADDRARGFIARSLVAIAVREGNPKQIHDWSDLGRPGIEVLTPNPRTSGGAMWNLVAIYGAAGGGAAGTAAVGRVLDNVAVMDKAARESLVNFERGIGDAAITYEQEVHVARLAGRRYDYVIPPATVVIEIPAAVVGRHADAHGRRALAEAFLAFLRSDAGQERLRAFGFRPATGPLDLPGDARFPPSGRPFRIDAVGGWARAIPGLFGPAGAISRVLEERRASR